MASITTINYIQIPFGCALVMQKTCTEAIWIIFYYPADNSSLRVVPKRIPGLLTEVHLSNSEAANALI